MKASQRALAYLHGAITAASERGSTRLPTIGDMAAAAGVSIPTMHRAVGALRREGVLSAVQHKGIHVLPDPGSAAAPAGTGAECRRAHHPKWRLIRQSIIREIWNHGFDARAFPHIKELCVRHGASYETVRHALDSCIEEGYLRPRTAPRDPLHQPGSHAGARLVLIARGTDLGELSSPTPRTRTHLHVLEHECAIRDIELVPVCLHYRGTDWVGYEPLEELERTSTVLGYVVWTAALDVAAVERSLHALRGSTRPIAVLDEQNLHSRIAHLLPRYRTRTFIVGPGTRPAEEMGRFLLGLGHRRIAHVTYEMQQPFYRERDEGLRRVFSRAGTETAVSTFRTGRTSTVDLSDNERSRFLAMMSEFLSVEGLAPGGFESRQRVASDLFTDLNQALARQQFREALYPQLDTLLHSTPVTAIVGYNDQIAVDILDYLHDRGVRVPRDVSVVGFDDTPEAFSYQLTSYEFNAAGVTGAVMHHILEPAVPRDDRVVQIEGRIVKRLSAGPAPHGRETRPDAAEPLRATLLPARGAKV